MLFERRAYTLRPGCEDAYWALHRQHNSPASLRVLLERNIGFFATTAGDGERIVHLYRWDSYDDAKQRLAAIVTPERADYFVTARKLLLRQENAYLDRAPVAELSPLWNDKRDWLPGSPAFPDVGNAGTLAISESVLDFLPGATAAYWEGFRKLSPATIDVACNRVIASFYVTVGSLHRVFTYHWHRSWPEAEEQRRQLAERPDWNAFMDDNRTRIVSGQVANLRPSPVSWMRALFEHSK
ncbi:MAG: NIPSNAP family protein [Proteobacteria bacterium]|nr:NIPSNAP family protein [Pseudomonadota bacterium]